MLCAAITEVVTRFNLFWWCGLAFIRFPVSISPSSRYESTQNPLRRQKFIYATFRGVTYVLFQVKLFDTKRFGSWLRKFSY